MSLGGSDVPIAPTAPQGSLIDPFALANTQQAFNTGSAVANQAGSQQPLQTPGWQQTYSQVGTGPGGIPIYGITQNLTGQNATNYGTYLGNQALAGAITPSLFNSGSTVYNAGLTPMGNAGLLQQGGADQVGQGGYNAALGAFLGSNSAFGQMPEAINRLNSAGVGLDQATNVMMGRYLAQDPSMIGNMTSGLAGERMNSYLEGIRPEQQFQRNTLDTQLRNQGLHPGQPGYDNAMRQLDTSTNNANATAMAQFQPQAWNQASQIYMDPAQKLQTWDQQAQQYAQLAAARQNAANTYNNLGLGLGNIGQIQGGLGSQYGALSNAATNLGQSYMNTGLSTMSQALPWLAASAPQMPPNPSATPLAIQPTNIGGLGSAYNSALTGNYANQLSAYNAQLAQQQNAMSGLFGIGSSVLGGLASGGFLSDRTLKENIVRVGEINGIPIYTFNYKFGGPTITGPMADEVEKVMPEAVRTLDGYKVVDYRMVMGW